MPDDPEWLRTLLDACHRSLDRLDHWSDDPAIRGFYNDLTDYCRELERRLEQATS